MSQVFNLRHLQQHKTRFIALLQWQQNQQQLHLTRMWSQQKKVAGDNSGKSSGLQEAAQRTDISTDVRPLGEKIKETTKTASYTAIIIAGVGVTSLMFWAIFRELFSSLSPNSIYSDALERVKDDPRVQDAIGAPIKGFGETSRRGRRQHVSHTSFERNGLTHMRMKFYIQGIRNKATVHLETRMSPKTGELEYRYLYVQLDHYPHTTIILEDNRALDPSYNHQFNASSSEVASMDRE